MEPFNFHRQEHLPQHDTQYSAPAPNTTAKPRAARKYKFIDHATVREPTLSQGSDTRDIPDLTNTFRRSAITCNIDKSGNHEPSREYLKRALQRWKQDGKLMFNFNARERRNPFPGVDMNKGWNRPRCDGRLYFLENQIHGTVEEKMKIEQGFRGYSLWAQLEPYKLDAEELKGIFGKIFVGETGVKEGWARTPGSWWAQRKNLFSGDRGVLYEETLAAQTAELLERVERWKLEADYGIDSTSLHLKLLSKAFVKYRDFVFWIILKIRS